MAPKTNTTSGTLLGRMVTERLRQLGESRRQFCLANGISRQTLYEIEHLGKVNLMTSTLVAIDKGCHWEPGTALKYATGDEHARDLNESERVDDYVSRILTMLSRLTIDELEREAIWLEQELFGRRTESAADSIRLINDAMRRVISTGDARKQK